MGVAEYEERDWTVPRGGGGFGLSSGSMRSTEGPKGSSHGLSSAIAFAGERGGKGPFLGVSRGSVPQAGRVAHRASEVVRCPSECSLGIRGWVWVCEVSQSRLSLL